MKYKPSRKYYEISKHIKSITDVNNSLLSPGSMLLPQEMKGKHYGRASSPISS